MRNEPDRERQITPGITYIWRVKKKAKVQLREAEDRKVAARVWGGRLGEIWRGW